MADIDLLFGVAGGGDVAGESGSLIKSQLESIIKGVEPLKIKVGIDIDASKKDFATDVESLFKGVSKTIKLKLDTSDISKPPSGNGGKGDSSILEKDTTSYYRAVTKLEKLQTSVRENLRKWTEAKDGASASDYQDIERQAKRLQALERLLNTGKLPLSNFEKYVSEISATVAKATDNIHLNEENKRVDADAYAEATKALKEYYKAQTDAIKYRDKISYNSVSNEWETQENNLAGLVKRLNETKKAYVDNIAVVRKFTDENKKSFTDAIAKESREYNEAVQAQNRKNTAAADAKAKTNEEKAYKKATAALKEYYKAQIDAVKFGDDIYKVGDQWETQNANLKSLVERLNETQKAFVQAETTANSFSDANKKLFEVSKTKEARALSEAIEAYNRSMEGAEVKEYQRQLDKVNDLLVQVKKNLKDWSSAKNGSSSSSYKGLEETVDVLEDMRSRLLDTGKALDDFDDGFDKVSSSAKNFSTSIKLAGENTKSIKKQVGDLLDTLGFSFTYADIFRKAIEIGQKMFETVVEVDVAMTELKKVTEEADSTYVKFLENAKSRAHGLGATVADTVSATADFARLGHSIADASALADTAIVYKNVGDGISDITTASESIISTMQAFKVEAKDAMSIIDSFNAVGNNFAISSKGIGDALLNSAASLSAAGNNIHESIALIAAANTTIQDPGKVGTALKTMSMYLRAAKTEAEEAGLSTENMANSVSELRDELLALTGGQVDIMSNVDAGEYKSTVEILRELSNVWDKLSDATKTNITELIGGGVRNANIISSLMQNFDIVEDALATSMGSAGSALAENEKYLDSVAGRVAQLKSSLESLSTTVLDSELVKFFVTAADAAVRLLTVISDVAFDNFFTTLSTLAIGGGAFTLFKDLD